MVKVNITISTNKDDVDRICSLLRKIGLNPIVEMTEQEAIEHDVNVILMRGGRVVSQGKRCTVIEMPISEDYDG